jgi:ribosomal protein L37E
MAKGTLPYCPICGNAQYIKEFEICRCCGFQSEYDDSKFEHEELKKRWMDDIDYFWNKNKEKK